MNINDEILVAYADGELDAHQAAEVEKAVASNSKLQARLKALTEAGQLTRSLFEAKSHEAVPDALVDSIMAADITPTNRNSAATRPSLLDRLTGGLPTLLPTGAFASIVLLGVGVLIGFMLPHAGGPAPLMTKAGIVPNDSPMHRLLNDSPSGQPVQNGPLTMEVVATFADTKQVCREYRAEHRDERREYHAGIACLRDSGEWSVAFAVDEYLEEQPAVAFYATASSKLHEAVDAFIDQKIDGDSLDDDAELALIESGWQINQ